MMRQVRLLFPETVLLSQFLLENRIRGAEVESRKLLLTAALTDELIVNACTQYQACIESMQSAEDDIIAPALFPE